MRAMKRGAKFMTRAVILIGAAAVLAACQSGPPRISITNAKAVLSPAIIGEAMVTMEIVNQGGSDVLKGVKTDIPGAKASIHVMQGQRMVTVDMMEVNSKSHLVFKMGGSHVMIEDMPKTMKEGSTFNLTLIFQKSGEKKIPLTLGKAPAMPMEHGHQM